MARWTHTDPNFDSNARKVLAKASSGAVLTARELQCLTATTVAVVGAMRDDFAEQTQDGVQTVDLSRGAASSEACQTIAKSLLGTFTTLAEPNLWQGADFETHAAPPQAGAGAGLVAVVAVCSAVGLAAAAWVAHEAAPVVDRYLTRREAFAGLTRAHADLVSLAVAHRKAEQDAGKALELSPAEEAAIRVLTIASSTAATKITVEPPLSTSSDLLGLGSIGALAVVGVAAAFFYFAKDRIS